jgi:hypothetical protein
MLTNLLKRLKVIWKIINLLTPVGILIFSGLYLVLLYIALKLRDAIKIKQINIYTDGKRNQSYRGPKKESFGETLRRDSGWYNKPKPGDSQGGRESNESSSPQSSEATADNNSSGEGVTERTP